MITIFFSPKPFADPEIITAQRNSIASWKALGNDIQIILFGDEVGAKEVADEFSIEFVPDVPCNQEGLPKVNDMFALAEEMSPYNLLMYINSDIILLSDFVSAVKDVSSKMRDKPFLMVGQRHDYDLYRAVDFNDQEWEKNLRENALAVSELRGPGAIDYFCFRKGMWPSDMPAFVIGRVQFDNWLIYCARFMGIDVVDTTLTVVAVHQNHEQKKGYYFKRRQSPEALEQIELTSKMKQNFLISDANLIHKDNGLQRPKLTVARLKRLLLTGSSLYPKCSFLFESIRVLMSILFRVLRVK